MNDEDEEPTILCGRDTLWKLGEPCVLCGDSWTLPKDSQGRYATDDFKFCGKCLERLKKGGFEVVVS